MALPSLILLSTIAAMAAPHRCADPGAPLAEARAALRTGSGADAALDQVDAALRCQGHAEAAELSELLFLRGVTAVRARNPQHVRRWFAAASSMGADPDFSVWEPAIERAWNWAQVPRPPAPSPHEAESLDPLDRKTWKWLEPRRSRLKPTRRAHTDISAHTLEWGEVELGIAHLAVGVLPRVQLSTVPVADAAGAWNASAKVHLLRLGPVDLSANGTLWRLRHELGAGDLRGVGATTSLRVAPGIAVHGSVRWHEAAIRSDAIPEASGPMRAAALTGEVATDIWLNRRDSLVFSASAMPWLDVETGLPPFEWRGFSFDFDRKGPVALNDAYIVTAAYQATFRNLSLRVGVGTSSLPGLWALQSTDIRYRFGGKTRRTERRMKRSWKANRPAEEPNADDAS